ncbi:hypothetical protein Hypma_014308 [Hypsizygus marmoreus]|uniref:Uncharacterized protein n=1 Tax=Hypsizygus marmoreus TaxID=39966 RepID=A0A369JCK8_HYPMA|nr:hypothetical protein Hypma_014308 [Hypsizygus marmoreus]
MRISANNLTQAIEDHTEDISGGLSFQGSLFIFCLLAFYALALWDRWLSLRLRTEENRRLQYVLDQKRDYGAMRQQSHSATHMLDPNAKSGFRPHQNEGALLLPPPHP